MAMLIQNDEDNSIECNGVGAPVFSDQEERKFFIEYQACDLNVRLGDCVRIKLEGDDDNQCDDYTFGQVLAIYEDSNEEFFIEVRWFLQHNELTPAHKKTYGFATSFLISKRLSHF